MAEKPSYEELNNRLNQLKADRDRYVKVEANLKKSIRFTESMLSAIPTPIFFKDVHGRYQGCNPAFSEIMGVTSQELRGKTVHELWPSEHAEVYHQKDLELMQHPKRQIYEFEIKDKNGTIRPVIFYKNAFHDDRGNVAGLVGGFVDITERKRAEKTLQESEEKYRKIANRVPGMVYEFVQHQDGSFSVPFISNRVYEYSGYRPEEVMADADLLFKAIHPEDIELVRKQIDRSAKSLNDFSVEHRIITPDGAILWFHVRSKPRLLENGDISWHGISNDITERKNLEQELKKSEKRYQSVSELTSDYSYAYRVEPDGELIIEWVTGAFESLTGFTADEVGSRGGWESLIYPEDMSIPLGQLKSLHSNQSTTVEYRIIDKADNIRWMRDLAKPIWDEKENRLKKIYGAVQEFTRQKEAEEALRSSHERFLTVLDSIDATIYVADMNTHEILFMNRHMIDAFGADLTGQICYKVFRKESDPCSYCTNDQLLDTDGNPTGVCVWETQNPITGKWYINHDRAIQWGDGRTVRLQIASDISMLKELEQERIRTEEQLRQAQKMESVGRLAGGVAHDFNNMLGVILGHTEMMFMGMNPGNAHYEDLQEIFKAARRSADLTRQLLAFARKQAAAPKVLDLNDTVEGMLNMLRRLIGEDIDLIWQPDTQLGPVMVDPAQVDQILANLCVNARDAISGTGKITIRTEDVVLDQNYCATHAGSKPGPYAMLSVSDDGCGMDKETQSHLFEPFFTTKKVGEGTGLGLATVYGIVKQNVGYINVSSELEQGTTFSIYLPRVQKTEKTKEESDAKTIPKGAETVLLVEDEKSLLNLGKTILERFDYKVLAAHTPLGAIELSEQYEGTIHLLVTDVVMPQMNGRELEERIKKLRPHIKVLFMSAYTSDVIAKQGILEDDVHFLEKPFSVDSLTDKVRAVLDKQD